MKDRMKKILEMGSIVLAIAILASVASVATAVESKEIETGLWKYGGILKLPPKKVYNNVWGAGDTERQSGTLKSYIYYKSGGSFGWEWNRSKPLSVNGHILPIYPEVILDSESGYFPKKLKDISSMTAELEYKYVKTPTGVYNLAYDMMLSNGGIKAEVMIWINGNSKPGIYGGDISDGYNTYELYYTNPTTDRPWAYYAFILKNQGSTIHKVNIKALLNKLVALGKLNVEWYIPFTNLGNEIWKGSGRIEISKWIVNINGNIVSPIVVYPNGGENWVKGTTKTIKWNYTSNTGSYVKIELLKGGVVNSVISSGTSNDGSHTWTIPYTQTLGTDYKVKVTSTANPIYADTSNNNFVISTTSIAIVSPNGGESWQRGTTKTITWSKVGSPGSYIKIDLYKAGIFKQTIVASTPNDGSYSWYVPWTLPAGSDYKIRITSTSNSAYNDWSNNYFRIY